MRTKLIVFLFFFLSIATYADIGKCIFYKVRIEKKDKSIIFGYFIYGTYDTISTNFTKTKFEEFIKLLSKNYFPDTITVYKKFQTLNYPNFGSSSHTDTIRAVAVNDIEKVFIKDIQNIDYLGYKECFYPGIIEELSQREIDLLQTKPLMTYLFHIDPNDDYSAEYFLLNYNSNMTKTELQDIIGETKSLSKHLYNYEGVNNYKSFRSRISTNNIILFRAPSDPD